MWRFKSIVQRFPQLWEKVTSLGKKGQNPLLELKRYKKNSSNLAGDVHEAHL
jgi:hypothetical protein